jgi:thimet oligopeptidase
MLATLLLGAIMIINSGPAGKADDSPFLVNMQTSDNYSKVMDGRLKHAQDLLDQLCNLKEKPTVDNALSVYDNILLELDAAGLQAGLIQEVHPDSVMRASSEIFSQKVSAFNNDLSLNRKVYDALAGIDLTNLDAQTKYYLQKTLRDFKLSGVDKDEATRAKITELRKELVLISQDFARNIREDVRIVYADNVKELEGLPQDFIDRHKPEADGRIKLTINYPDAIPVFTYAKSESLRKRMYMEYNNRAFPKNIEVLNKMIAKRYELANLLGYPNWAAYITADKMVGSEKNAFDFIEKIANASHDRSEREYQIILDRKKQDIPGATEINAWESGYYSELVRKAKYDFDGQKVRPYFPYDEVKQGILNVYSKLFGVEFRRNNTAPVWHSSVECYDTYENGNLVGRFYLDMHPRENKYNHAAQFGVRNGVEGKQIPEAALICNFPGGETNDPGLMEHSDVQTFFHEFGHLLHTLFGGHLKWIGIAGISTEWDFVEAPSQLLEEWSWDPATLQTFALNYQTKEPIPTELVKQMRRANEFGKGLGVTGQMYYAKLSLSYYDRNPKDVNTTELVKTLRGKYTPFKYVEGTHMQTAFGHLDEYSAIYYTYMWSLVIAKDFFSKFDKKDLLAHDIAKRYRDAVLAPGGSKPASELVKIFLGRDLDFASWQKWLNEGE